MLLHKFHKDVGLRCALTQDKSGGNLPNDGMPWIYEKPIYVYESDEPRIGASSVEIIAGVQADGYFLWPAATADDA